MNRALLPFPRAGSARQVLLGIAMLALAAAAQAQELPAGCGGLKNHYGPFDYRVHRGSTLDIVDSHHFTPKVEMLIRGSTGSIGQDLSYTLRAYPNHHRALLSAERYAERMQTAQPRDMEFTIECYYQRALAWKPDDSIARLLYARYLFKAQRTDDAKAQLNYVSAQRGVAPFTIYNVGMVALEFKAYELAIAAARRASAEGFEGRGLIEQLAAQGQWSEAGNPPAAAASAASAASAPAPEASAPAAAASKP